MHAAAARAAMAAALNSRGVPPPASCKRQLLDLELPRVDNPVPKYDAEVL
jgi:hypothetical protein